MNSKHQNPPARYEDITRVETLVGCRLPEWLRDRLLKENGFGLRVPLVYGEHGNLGIKPAMAANTNHDTGELWRICPVLDRTNKKSQTRTAEDIAWHTARARAVNKMATGVLEKRVSGQPFPSNAVMIGLRQWFNPRPIPDPHDPTVLDRPYELDERLFLLPDPADPAVLGLALYRQFDCCPAESLGIKLPELVASPDILKKPDSHLNNPIVHNWQVL
jgi:hypothetical protein